MTKKQRGLVWRWAVIATFFLGFLLLLDRVPPQLMKLLLLIALPIAVLFDRPLPVAETPGELLEEAADRHPIIRWLYVLMAIISLAAFWISTHSQVRWLDLIGDRGFTIVIFAVVAPIIIAAEYRRYQAYGTDNDAIQQ